MRVWFLPRIVFFEIWVSFMWYSSTCECILSHTSEASLTTQLSTLCRTSICSLISSRTIHWRCIWLPTETTSLSTFRWIQNLVSNFKSQLDQHSIYSMTSVISRCGRPQCLMMWRMILWWKSIVQMHSMPQCRVWCMLSGLKTKKHHWTQPTTFYRLENFGR
jgi:hypothetical protein